MEIYIDNEKTRFGKRSQDFEKILTAIMKKLEKNEKVIRNIYINGKALEEDTVIDMSCQNIVEVETSSYSDIVLETLVDSKEYIDLFFEVKENLNQKIENKEKIEDIDIEDISLFLGWILDVMHLLNSNYVFSFGNVSSSFLELVDECDTLEDFRQKRNYISYVDTLNYKISTILEKFRDNIDYYSNHILEEEKSKKNLF